MKNLVIGVSAESSLDLLGSFADIIKLDKDSVDSVASAYDTVYIRSHFSEPSLTPEYFRSEIEGLVRRIKSLNPNVRFIDSMDTVDAIMAFEDKWLQYVTFGSFMPRSEKYDDTVDISGFERPVYKRRFSSNGSGVTWDKEKAVRSNNDWIIQESLNIQEELRIYVIFGEVYPIGAVRRSMTEGQKAQAINFRKLTEDEIDFSLSIMEQSINLDIVGIDAARTIDGELRLIEVNRSPGFAKFNELTGINLASVLYEKLAATKLIENYSSGGVVLHNGNVLVIYSPSRDSFGLPKGTIDAGESQEETAIREVKEETGYSTEILEKLGDYTYEFDWTDGNHHSKTVSYFLMKLANDKPPQLNLQPGEDFEVLWLPIPIAFKKLTFSDAKESLERALRLSDYGL